MHRNLALRRLTAALLLVGMALGARLPLATPAYAATWTVTTTQDAPHALPIDGTCTSTLSGGTCTLRAAFQAANYLTGGPYSIDLQAQGTYLLTVTGANENLAATGDLDLNNANVVISNASGGSVILDGNLSDRIFDVGPQTAAQLSLSSVTLQRGQTGGPAGALQIGTGSTVTLAHVTLQNNSGANGAQFAIDSGAIYNSGTLTADDITVSGNTSVHGAAVVNASTGHMTITNSNIVNNVKIVCTLSNPGHCPTDEGSGISGTGILTLANVNVSGNSSYTAAALVAGGASTLNHVTVSNNTSTGAGGGVSVGGTASLNDLTVTGNSGTGISASGQTTITNTTISQNTFSGISGSSPLTITNVAVLSNNGGGMFLKGGQLTNVNVSNNSTPSDGGGIYNFSGTLSVLQAVISNNSAVPSACCPTTAGGGVKNSGTATLDRVLISGNSATYGGGLYNAAGTLTVTNSTVSTNTATSQGGGLNNAATTNLNNVTLSNNSGAASMGGGIYNSATTNLKNTIVANSPTGGNCAGSVRPTSQGDNLSSDGTCNLAGAGDRNNTNPLLGPLQDNGGSTLTHALLPGSPAIDAVTHNTCPPPAVDQRGITRPQGVACDIGAYEAQPQPVPTATPTLTPVPMADLAITKSASPDSPRVNTNLNYLLTVTNNGPSPSTGVTVTDNLPPNTQFISARPSQGTCGGPPQIVCSLGNLAVGASATINMVVQPTQAGALTNGASVTGSPTDPNAGNNSATVTNTVQAASCATRPPVQVGVQPVGGGRLQATLSVGTDSNVPSNQFHGYSSGRVTNALIDIPGGPTGVTSFSAVPPPGTQQLVFVIRQVDPNQGASVEIAVTDDCGDWPTVVGGGPAVFQGGGAPPSAPNAPAAVPSPTTRPAPTATRTPGR